MVQASYKHWEDIFTGAMGRDSLTFIIYFKGYDTKDHHQALKDLENLLDFDRLELNLLSFLSLKKHPIITRLLTHGYEGPIFVELSFQKIKGDLEDHYKIGAKALNIFHFLGTLGADTLGNVILCSLRPKKDKDGWWLNTFFRADIGQNLLFLNLEEDKLPFFLPGYDYDISLVRYALLALKMKFDFPFLSIMVFSFLRDSFSSSPLKFYFGDRVLRLRKDMLDPSEKMRLTILKRLEVKNPLKKP
ncbi:MAG: hypothetical protein LBE27_01335 [Deltaproteobacteria bacterium]|nr:hypothetical protein [Deltaproteobacteria bacterium]